MNKGVLYAATAYLLWGVFPVYWKLLDKVPAYEILVHRMLWTFVVTLIVLTIRRDFQWLHKVNKRTLITFVITGLTIASNWLVFIWAVNRGFIVEASLGYFINPLIHVLFGVIFLKEHLRLAQVFAILIAAAGVIYLTLNYGQFPWIALYLAVSFALYALLRKTAVLNSLEGLSMETGVLFIPAFFYLAYVELNGTGALTHSDPGTAILLVGTGVITALPLLLFASGARRIPLVSIGILQYIAPTLQFMMGVFVFHEPFPRVRLVGFTIIWIALVIYTVENLVHYSRRQFGKRTEIKS